MILASLLLAMAGSARAVEEYEPGVPENVENPSIMAVNNSVSLAYLNANMDYREPSDVDAFNTGTTYDDYEEGGLSGARLSASWMSPTYADFYLHADWGGATGTANYTGFVQETIGGTTYDVPATGISGATIQDYDLKLGKGFVTARNWMLTPYWTFGGRHWTRVIGEGTSGDYNETYQHFDMGFGGLVQWAPTDGWVLTGDATLGRTFYAWINDPPDGLDHAPLGAAPIIKLGVELDGRLNDCLHFFTGFDYTYFTYGQSDVYLVPNTNPQEGVLEPISVTQMFDVTVGARFSYF